MNATTRKPQNKTLAWAFVPIAAALAFSLTVPATAADSTNQDLPAQAAPALARRPDLTGIVSARAIGLLAIRANVFIATAAPKTGSSTFCPSCYADCIKHAQTDAQGHFKIESLDPQLTFRILAVAKGYRPRYVSNVDPALGPVYIDLDPLVSTNPAPDHSVRGRVINAKGEPVEGAAVEMEGVRQVGGGGMWGSIGGVDPLAVTDENGEFLLTSKGSIAAMDLEISARAYADKLFANVPAGSDNQLTITEGSGLSGRVVRAGKPLAGVSVGVSGADRTAGNYLGRFDVATDTNGAFSFVNLPPSADFYLYTLMDTMHGAGAVPVQPIHTGKDGETINAGSLSAVPAHRLVGQVVLADGQPVPPSTRLLVSRQEAWDSRQVILDRDGRFEVGDIPGETISLSARVKGYHVSARNASLDDLNPFQLIGRVDHDITNLVFMLEKGPDIRPDYNSMPPDYMQSRNRPLRGQEGGRDHSQEWTVSGRVLDADTKGPVPDFQVISGQVDQFQRSGWNSMHPFHGSNGVYVAYVNKRTTEPRLKVLAEGYLPQAMDIQSEDATNIDFFLKRGAGPAGTVLNPDGTPAAGATVVVLGEGWNQASLRPHGELSAFSRPSALGTVDGTGRFSLKPDIGYKALVAGSSNGVAMLSLEALATNPVIHLEAFGQISGKVTRPSGPLTNEDLDLTFAGDAPNRAGINLNFHAVTDAQGAFKFEGVPPGRFAICYRLPMNQNSWQNKPVKEVELEPSQTLVVDIVTTDHPTNASENFFRQPPSPKPIPGAQLKGIVLLPGGKPAADADVALQVEGKFLQVGKGVFVGVRRDEGLLVGTGLDGSFTLPLYEKAQSVVALNEQGYAQVSLEALKVSPQIQLQKWGRVEGVLRNGNHPGANEELELAAAMHPATNANSAVPPQVQHEMHAFTVHTDAQGRFVFTFVPPGEQALGRLISIGPGSQTARHLANFAVSPDETVVTNVTTSGRTVTGKVNWDSLSSVSNGLAGDFRPRFIGIGPPMSAYWDKLDQLKTRAERQAFSATNQFQLAGRNAQSFTGSVQPDGSFRIEDVPPGTYELILSQPFRAESQTTIHYTSAGTVIVPASANDDDSVLDVGTVELKSHELPLDP